MFPFYLISFTSLFAYVLPVVTTSKETMTSVWVVSGGRADLPCQPRPREKDDQPNLVLWYRSSNTLPISSNTLPIYSYDARVGDFSSGVRWADEVAMGGRAYYAAAANPPALVLTPTYAHDEGIYTCRVDYQRSTSTISLVNLTVVVSPGPPVVIWDGREMVGTVGPLQENEMTGLTCRSIGGRPTPVLTWWNEGRQLPLLSTNSSMDPVTGTRAVEATLSVTAKRELQGASLTCKARTPTDSHVSQTAIVDTRSASVTLNITLSPVEVRILESDSLVVTSGSTISVICRALGSHPPAEISWWRGSWSMEQHVTHAIDDGGNITMATLTIVVTGKDDGVDLTCSGTNPALPDQPLTDTTKLIVYYKPVVELSLGRQLEPENIKENVDVYFECSIKANPRFHRIEWYHNGQEISQNVTAGVVISGQSLVIRSLERKHSGSYTCIATNAQGRESSKAVHLTVRHSPVCAGSSGKERTQGAARGTLATAKCTVEAEPSQDITWSWVRRRTDGSEEKIPKEDFITDGLTSTISVIPERREDYGRLLCRATNDVGYQKEPCVVNLVPAGPPDIPTNCTAAPINPEDQVPAYEATLVVSCLEGFDGGLPQNFILEAWQDGIVLANMTSEFPEWVVGGVRAGKGVILIIVGYNIRGRSDPVKMEVHTTSAQHRAAPDQETSIEVPPLVGAALGVVGVILLLLLVGVAIARRAQTRPRKPSVDKTLASTSAEGFDPDVVQSIHRCPPSLDVLPCPQEQHSKEEESHPMFSYSDQGYPSGYRQGQEGIQDKSNQGVSDEVHLVSVHGQVQDQSYACLRQHHTLGRDGQGLNCSHSQSDDSGVSESESDSELKHPAGEGQTTTAFYREGNGGRLYIAVPTGGGPSLQINSSVEVSVESSSCDGDSGNQRPSSSTEASTKCSSSTEFRETSESCRQHPVRFLEESPLIPSQRESSFKPSSKEVFQSSGLGLYRRSPYSTGDIAGSVTSPVEVICLAVSPTMGTLNPLPTEVIKQHPSNVVTPNVHQIAVENPCSEPSEHLNCSQKHFSDFDSSNIGLPVTLLEAGNGEILLLTRKNSEYERTGKQTLSPVYAITTLPKASGKRSKSNSGKRTHGVDPSSIKTDSQILPPVMSKNKGLDTKHVGKREYLQPSPPDVCRRESSV